MNANLDGRELLYNLYMQNPDLCRQAIRDMQCQADKDYRRMRGPNLNHLLSVIGFQDPVQLSAIFHDPQQERAFRGFLRDKAIKKPEGVLLPICWQKLFDKIVDPAKGMKSAEAKRMSQIAKESPAVVRQMWQEHENQIIRVVEKHNREIAQLDFRLLVDEIDERATSLPNFQTALRYWACNSSNQPGGPRLQELFTIANFAQDFKAWQEVLLDEFSRSRKILKLFLLSQKLVSFLEELVPIRRAQKGYMDRLIAKTQLPTSVISMSLQELNHLFAEVKVLDSIVQRPAQWLVLPAAADQPKKI